jgi:SAM-dependent methyltransferase
LSPAAKLQQVYDQLLISSYPTNGISVPARVLRYYVNLTGYEYAQTIREFVGEKNRVLLIGDAGGRDYYFLSMVGNEVYVVDIAEQALPNLVRADATSLPFLNQSFDAVVMAEVVEHLIEDYKALKEVRRVLRGGGVFVLTVPYYHDDPEYHVRIHSPRSIERLLQATGFHIARYIEKGGGFTILQRFRVYTYTLHFLNLLAFWISERTFYSAWNELLATVDLTLGRGRRSAWHRWSRHYGAFIQCVKAKPFDFRELNKQTFQNPCAKHPDPRCPV